MTHDQKLSSPYFTRRKAKFKDERGQFKAEASAPSPTAGHLLSALSSNHHQEEEAREAH